MKKNDIEFFSICVSEIFNCEKISEMNLFTQHGGISCLDHSVFVAYLSFWFCRKFNIKADTKSLIRGALLHDFFLYDWHERPETGFQHLRLHPTNAYNNAIKYFNLNEMEKDIILTHMWPLTFSLPKHKESVIVNAADTLCALFEGVRLYPRIIAKKLRKLALSPSFA